MSRLRRMAPTVLAGSFILSATVHLLRPQAFEPIMPRSLPTSSHRALIYLSGLTELACGYGLFRHRGWAGPASTAVLAAVFPANVQMALDSGSGRNPGVADNRLLAWARLPLQLPMIWAARQVGRQPGDS